MKPATANAIKALLKMDATVTTNERLAIVEAMSAKPSSAAALDLAGEVSVADAADYLSMSRTTLWRMCSRGDVCAVRRGKKYYIAGADVARLKSAKEVA
ncbi:MAG: helix-turn-helix domain-containing protein [Kiritimatiellae bacterium]|nr:helix-turn-helix domain-containing protein [Kiritimatiellia bacterium]